jgi:hypothetical protein
LDVVSSDAHYSQEFESDEEVNEACDLLRVDQTVKCIVDPNGVTERYRHARTPPP